MFFGVIWDYEINQTVTGVGLIACSKACKSLIGCNYWTYLAAVHQCRLHITSDIPHKRIPAPNHSYLSADVDCPVPHPYYGKY